MSAVFLEAAVVFVCSVTTTEQPSPAALLVCGLPSSPMRAVIDDLAFLLSADFFWGYFYLFIYFLLFLLQSGGVDARTYRRLLRISAKVQPQTCNDGVRRQRACVRGEGGLNVNIWPVKEGGGPRPRLRVASPRLLPVCSF